MKTKKLKIPRLFKKKEQHFNVIDLGSTDVKVAVVREGDDIRGREILGDGVRLHERNSIYGGKIVDLDAVVTTVTQAFDEAVMKAGVSPVRTVVGLSGGIMAPKSYRVRIKRQDPDAKLEEDEFNVLADQIEDKTIGKALKELREFSGADYVRVETLFTAYAVDGAKVSSPLGLPGAALEITVLHYFMDAGKLRSINNLVDQIDLEVVSMVDTTVNAAINWQDKYDDFLLIDVGGDVTQVVLMEKGRVTMSECLFVGGYDVTNEIKERLQIPFEQADGIKLQYASGQLDQERARDVRAVVTDVADVIIDGVVVVTRKSSVKHFPSQIVLSGESRHLGEFKSAIASFPWNKETKFSVFPKIDVVTGKDPNFTELIKVEL
jgi:cell division protein FtsA